MSPYRSREAPVPRSSVSETHPGFWSDYINREKSIYNRWYNNYGRFYYERPGTSENEAAYGSINGYVPPLKERRYLHDGRVSPSQPVAYLKACLEEKKLRDASAQLSTARTDVSCKFPLQLSHISNGYASLHDRPDRVQYCGSSKDGAYKLCCTCTPRSESYTEKSCVTHKPFPVAPIIERKSQHQYIDLSCVPLNNPVQLAEYCRNKGSETCVPPLLSKKWDKRSLGKEGEKPLHDSLPEKHGNWIFWGSSEKGFVAPKSTQGLYSCKLHGGINSFAGTDEGQASAPLAKYTHRAMVDERSCQKPQKLHVSNVLTWHMPWHAAQEGKRVT